MKKICEDGMCAGCMACVDVCPTSAVSVSVEIDHSFPVIDQQRCIDCGRCRKVCQQRHPAARKKPIGWYQGWAKDPVERAQSSSGGFASAIARSFMESGGKVCACAFENGEFSFVILDKPCDLVKVKGSKYVKSNPKGSYRAVAKLLREKRKVLFIGLPCQVSAMRAYLNPELIDGLYTIDLICHGTPSPVLLEQFLEEQGSSIDLLEDVSFRHKMTYRLSNKANSIGRPGATDRYLVAFLNGVAFTENCYSCVYATDSRVSDLTLGDSWGSELKEQEALGISLALVQSEKGRELLENADVEMLDVDLGRAIEHNQQLQRPSDMPETRGRFLADLSEGRSVNRAVFRALPKQCLKQEVKRVVNLLIGSR